MVDKVTISLESLDSWLANPMTKVLLRVCSIKEHEILEAIAHLDLAQPTDRIALKVANFSGAKKLLESFQDRESLKGLFREVINWKEEIESDGSKTLRGSDYGRSRGS